MQTFTSLAAGLKVRFGTVTRLFRFMWRNKLWWLMPMVVVLVAFFLIMIFAQGSPLGPFIYTLF